MNANDSQRPPEPRLRDTLRQDLKHPDFFQSLRRDFSELRQFYIEEEKNLRLAQMTWYKRGFFLAWWLFKSMMLKLTPARRILFFVGFVLILASRSVGIQDDQIQTSNWEVLGGFLLVFVLMLELKDKLLARDELEAGQKVQNALMPERSPNVPGWSLWLFTRPANEVGGDLVDFLRINEERSGVVLADVAGKGLQAALLMVKLQATIRALASDFQSTSDLMSRINKIFHRDTPSNMFASLLYVELRDNSGELRFVNAGHFPPVLLGSSGIREMSKGETGLGLVSASSYSEQIQTLQRGETFLAYSDGLTEARNEQGDFFGTERLFRLLSRLGAYSVEGMGQAITSELDQFVGEARANDDLSLIILRRN